MIAAQGMSTRAIAPIVGVSKSSVADDIAQMSSSGHVNVTHDLPPRADDWVMPTTPRTFVTWRRHRCTRRHRTARTWMRCALRRVEWISGRGRFAVIAYCRVTTVTLWDTPDAARHACRLIDATGCGGRCSRRHQLVIVEGVTV